MIIITGCQNQDGLTTSVLLDFLRGWGWGGVFVGSCAPVSETPAIPLSFSFADPLSLFFLFFGDGGFLKKS